MIFLFPRWDMLIPWRVDEIGRVFWGGEGWKWQKDMFIRLDFCWGSGTNYLKGFEMLQWYELVCRSVRRSDAIVVVLRWWFSSPSSSSSSPSSPSYSPQNSDGTLTKPPPSTTWDLLFDLVDPQPPLKTGVSWLVSRQKIPGAPQDSHEKWRIYSDLANDLLKIRWNPKFQPGILQDIYQKSHECTKKTLLSVHANKTDWSEVPPWIISILTPLKTNMTLENFPCSIGNPSSWWKIPVFSRGFGGGIRMVRLEEQDIRCGLVRVPLLLERPG